MTAAGGALPGQNRQSDMDAAVVRLMALAANKRAARPRPEGDDVYRIEGNPFTLSSIFAFPEPTPELKAADAALVEFANELVRIGGMSLMLDVYDETAERHGYRAVSGVSPSWDGHHGWAH